MIIGSHTSALLKERIGREKDVFCSGLFLSARWFVVSQAAVDGINVVILPTKEAAEYCSSDLYNIVEGDKVFFLPDSGKAVERSNYKSSLLVQRTSALGKIAAAAKSGVSPGTRNVTAAARAQPSMRSGAGSLPIM